MERKEQIALLKNDVKAWNDWRAMHREEEIDFSGAYFSKAKLDGADLRHANLKGARFERADLSGANLNCAILSDAYLFQADLNNADLGNADLTGVRAEHANFSGANLREATLDKARLNRAILDGAYLNDAMLYAAKCNGASFRQSDLEHANLEVASLREAKFHEAILRGANLTRADLEGAFFDKTILGDTILRNVTGLASVKHQRGSDIDQRTLALSGLVDSTFLCKCGLQKWQIEMNRLYHSRISPEEVKQLLRRIEELLVKVPIYYSCFISYSHHQDRFARKLHQALVERGVECYLDRHDREGGAGIYESLVKAIQERERVLLCCSQDSMEKSSWVEREFNIALDKEVMARARGETSRVLIPLDLDGYVLRESENFMCIELRSRFMIDFSKWDKDEFGEKIDEFGEKIEELLNDLEVRKQ